MTRRSGAQTVMASAGSDAAAAAAADAAAASAREEEAARAFAELGSVQKCAWPELLGADVDAAVAEVERERPDLLVVRATPEGAIVSADWAVRRVRVYHDANRRVSRTPQVG